MTQIKGSAVAERRAGVLGVHSLDHFGMTVPSLSEAQHFYSSFGLETRSEGAGLALHTADNPHRFGYVTEGPRKKLHHLSFGAYADDLVLLRERLKTFNIERLDPPPGFQSNGLWFRDYEGTLVEIKAAEKTSPNRKTSFETTSSEPAVRGTVSRRHAPFVRPRRLAHTLLYTGDVEKAVEFYCNVLGLRLSDGSQGRVAFLHGVHGSDHHLIAFVRSGGPGLHHCSWDVGSVDDVGLGAMQMANKGFVAGWGLGRHVLGSNYFHYVRDPWGSYAEYSADMDFIPSNIDWKAADHPAEDSSYLWGPTPPSDIGRNYELEG